MKKKFVYILAAGHAYEGSYNLKVFLDKKKAEQALEDFDLDVEGYDDKYIEEHEVEE